MSDFGAFLVGWAALGLFLLPAVFDFVDRRGAWPKTIIVLALLGPGAWLLTLGLLWSLRRGLFDD